MERAAKKKRGKAADEEALSVQLVAQRFRHARCLAGLSQRQLADRAGLAASTVHKIEAGRLVPSLAVCIRLADGLGRRISDFVEQGPGDGFDVRFTRGGSGRVTHAPESPLRFEYVAEPLMNPSMEAFVLTIAPGGSSGADVPVRYRGEEVVFGLEGRVRFRVRGEEYIVGPGDTLHLKGSVPHTWENAGARTARLLMVCAFAYERV